MLVVVLIAVLTDICGNSIALEVALSDARALGVNRAPMTAISVDLAIYGGPIERIVRGADVVTVSVRHYDCRRVARGGLRTGANGHGTALQHRPARSW